MFSYTQAGQVNKKLLRVWRTVSGYLLWADPDSSYGYDNEGKLTSVTYPQALDRSNNVVGGTTYTYGYDSMARLYSMTGPNGAVISSATYGPAGELLSLAGVVNETRTYNTRLQLTRLSAPHMTCTYWTCTNDGVDYTYTYSASQNNGRIVQQTDNITGEQVTYQYDELNRLIWAVTADNPSVAQWGQAFLYDGFGNLTDKSVIKGSAPVWHGLVDPATNRASGYVYDANGNATSPSLQNAFDIENRIVSQTAWVQSSQYMYNYGYDPDNRRVYKATSSYDPGSGGYTLTGEEVTFWSPTGQRMGTYTLLVDPSGNGYAPSLSFRWTNSERVYFGNRLMWRGGAAVYTDRLGSVGKYFPYGEERPSVTAGDGEKFATYFRDGATGLDYAVNRYYDSGTGRFLTPDLGAPNNAVFLPDNWNRYAYVSGDPVNKTDPLGLCSPSDDPSCYSVTGTTFPDLSSFFGLGANPQRVNPNRENQMEQQAEARAQDAQARREALNYLPAALSAALDALSKEDCRKLFGDLRDPTSVDGGSLDPVAILKSLASFRGSVTGTARWSPDSRWLAFDSREEGHSAIYIMSVAGGAPRRLDMNSFEESMPSWSRDGRYVYYTSTRGGGSQLWKKSVTGGSPVRVTEGLGFDAMESPDGRWVYFLRKGPGIWRVPVTGGEECAVPELAHVYPRRYWAVASRGIYLVNQGTPPRLIQFFSFATRKLENIATIEGSLVAGTPSLTVSPDEQWLLYSQNDQRSSDVMMLENFR